MSPEKSLLLLTTLKLVLSASVVLGFFVLLRLHRLLKNCLLCANPIQFRSRLGLGPLDKLITWLGTQVLASHGFLMNQPERPEGMAWNLILARQTNSFGRQFLFCENEHPDSNQTPRLTTPTSILDDGEESTIQLSVNDWVICMGNQRTLSFFDPMLAMAQHAAARELRKGT